MLTKIRPNVEELRELSSAFTTETFLAKYPDLEHTEYTIPGPKENPTGTIAISVFKSKTSTSTKRPASYNIHGGGQIAGNRFSGLEIIAKWYDGIDVVHVCVEYRLAPEHRAPAALQDSYAGLVWTVEHAEELSIDPTKILVQGTSGGAPIAAACAILSRNKQYPKLVAQLLSTPMLDDRVNSVSSQQFENDGPWDGKTNRMAWDCVLGSERGGPNVSEILSPSRATDLAGVAPAFIDVGGAEVFRDEAVAYASVLWKSGVSTELHVWPGGWHGFDLLLPDAAISRAATAAKVSWLRRVLLDET